jgi:hypothetical protein
MKPLILGMTLICITSCGIGNRASKSFSESIGTSISKGIEKTGENIGKSLTGKKDIESEGEYIEVTKSQLGLLSCIVKMAVLEVPVLMIESLIEGITKKKFDIIIPKSLSKKIVRDLRAKSKNQKINPEEFWIRLDSSIAQELNNLLVKKFIKLSDEEFELIQKEVAMGLTLLVESGEYSQGLKLKLDTKNGEKKFSIAFDNDAVKKVDISSCSDYDVSDIALPLGETKPSDITTLISCNNSKNESLEIKGMNNNEITVKILTKGSSEPQTININEYDLEVTKENKRYNRFGLTTNEFDMFKLELPTKNSSKKSCLVLKLQDAKKIKIKNLKCDITKELSLP